MYAQTNFESDVAYKQAIAQAIAPLNKAQIPTGYLFDSGLPAFRTNQLQPTRIDSNQVNLLFWQVAYESLYSMHIHGTQSLPTSATVETALDPYQTDSSAITLPILLAQYAHIREDAITQNLIQQIGSQFYDVQGRTQSPYIVREAFAIAPSMSQTRNQTATFVFRNNLFYSNFGITSAQVQTLQIDAGDGQGWRTVAWNTPFQATYPTAGTKTLAYRLTFTNGTVREAHSFLKVVANPVEVQTYSIVADTTFLIGDARERNRVSIIYSKKYANLPKKLRKPFIIVEGFDSNDVAPLLNKENYDLKEFIRQISVPADPNNPNILFTDLFDDVAGYDLVFMDYGKGTDHITENAEFFRKVVKYVNANKVNMPDGTRAKNVVLGLSMGGLVARYGLAKMQKLYDANPTTNVTENPDTRLVASYDSPHRGANIPVGFQAIMRMMYDVRLIGNRYLRDEGEAGAKIVDGIDAYNSPASQQMLLYQVRNHEQGIFYNDFIANVYQPMVTFPAGYVMPYKFVALSAGAECGQGNASPQAPLMNGNFSSGPFKDTWLGNIMNNLIVYWTFEMRVKAQPAQGNAEVAYLSVKRKMPLIIFKPLGALFGDISITMFQKSYHAGNNMMYLDGVQGGAILSGDLFDKERSGITFPTHQVTFIPTASALDVNLNPETLTRKYLGGSLGSNTNSKANKFITQELHTNEGGSFYNRLHDNAPTSRMAMFLYREMENLPQTEVCNRPCSPALPTIAVNTLLCTANVGNPIFVSLPTGTGITWNTSSGLSVIYQGTVPHLVWNGVQKGAGWVEASLITDAGCSFPLNRVAVWRGNPTLGFTIQTFHKKINNIYYLCTDQLAGFTFSSTAPSHIRVEGFEVNATECALDQEVIQHGSGRTEFRFKASPELCTGYMNIRAFNECGESEWVSIPFRVTPLCSANGTPCPPRTPCDLSGEPCPPDVICDRLSGEAFENPFGQGTRFRLTNVLGVDYNHLTDDTPVGFSYQILVFDGQGNLKYDARTDKVQKYIDLSHVSAGTYYIKAVFENGAYTNTLTIIKQP